MIALGKVRLGAFTIAAGSAALLVALPAIPRAARAQETPPPVGNAAPSVAQAPGNEAPPAQPISPPPGQPYGAPPGQPSYPPPGQSYPPGYAPPGYAQGYAPPGYPPGYGPPRYAPPEPAEPTHSGVYVHLHLGGGFTSISGSDGSGGNLKVSGGGPSFTIAVGGAVAPNLALFGTLFFSDASQPRVTSNGSSLGQGDGDAFLGGFGAGIVYYFMPVDIYLSGAVAGVQFEADDSDGKTTYQSDVGLGFQGMIGKEFWVSDHWGLGAAFEFIGASSMKDKNDTTISWSGAAFNLVFSATYF